MTIFDERERAFETMFAHDEEMRFRALARRNRLLGLWVAEQLGLAGENARAYAAGITGDLATGRGDEELVRKIRHDFESYGVQCSAERLREKIAELQAQALLHVRRDSQASA
jgi:hypothetical protein